MTEDPYVYPGTNVLRNHFGLRNGEELERRERDASNFRLAELQAKPLPGRYDLAHLQAFHRHIFGDVWPWAGEIRTVAIAKTDLFALPQHVAAYLSDVLSRLPGEKYLRGLGSDQMAGRLAHYLARDQRGSPVSRGQRPHPARVHRPDRRRRRLPHRVGPTRP